MILFRKNFKFLSANNFSHRFTNSLGVSLKESLVNFGELDYPKKKIMMDISSYRQITRLRACRKEPETVQWIESNFRKGDTFYDIGANVGAYSLVAWAVMGDESNIYAFEPNFLTFTALGQNIIINKCSDMITPFQVAFSDKTKTTSLHYSGLSQGDTGYILDSLESNKHQKTIFVQKALTYKLDDFLEQFGLDFPNHIKIDTDGSELNILKGSSKILAHPELRSILVEIDEQLPDSFKIIQYLENFCFHVASRHDHGGGIVNYIFKKND